MKPDSPTGENANSEEGNSTSAMSTLASVMSFNSGGDVDREFDMDDEIMNFMHSHIHKQLIKFTNKDTDINKQGMMDGDTKAYFDEVIRGSALFGLLPDDDDDGDKENNEESFFSSPVLGNDEDESDGTTDNLAKFQLSRLLLTKKVAEAFMLNRSDNRDDDAEGDAGVGGNMASFSWGARLLKGNENALIVDDYKSPNTSAPMRTPFGSSNESSSTIALDEIRARLRKTQFDYSSDSAQKVTDATPPQFDYRNVLKKK